MTTERRKAMDRTRAMIYVCLRRKRPTWTHRQLCVGVKYALLNSRHKKKEET